MTKEIEKPNKQTEAKNYFLAMCRVTLSRIKPEDMNKKEWEELKKWTRKQITELRREGYK